MRALLIAIALTLAACAPQTPPADTLQPATPAQASDAMPDPPVASASETADCAAKGGSIQPVCRLQRPMCVIAYKDAGKTCTDGGQCEGDCAATEIKAEHGPGPVSGQCTVSNNPCGCRQFIVNGVPQPALCVD